MALGLRALRGYRDAGLVLLVLGIVVTYVGVIGFTLVACPVLFASCPLGGCAWVPGCPGWQNLVLTGGGMATVLAGVFLLHRRRTR